MSICTCTPKQKASGKESPVCEAHMGFRTRIQRKKPIVARVVGKITVECDDPNGKLPWAVVSEHAEMFRGRQVDLGYFKTSKLAHDCAKRVRKALRGPPKKRAYCKHCKKPAPKGTNCCVRCADERSP